MIVVDHFLNNFVFPRHAKQFAQKLVTSGWDLPLLGAQDSEALTSQQKENINPSKSEATFSLEANLKSSLTTGFSGTNDNRNLLPLTIKQQDLASLQHTNAEVLTYLLQGRNRGYICVAHGNGKRKGELEFLQMVEEKGIKMIIDAGAQILELDNEGLVKAWLRIATRAPAAV